MWTFRARAGKAAAPLPSPRSRRGASCLAEKPGVCPLALRGSLGPCPDPAPDSCREDGDCEDAQKCCSVGCRNACREPEEDVCRLPRDPGPCKAFRTRTFYNVTSKACERFQYGGCGGNKNNFVNPELCLRTSLCLRTEKPGSCPVFPAYVREPCEKLCKHDQDCLGALKCCSMMCSMVCLRPFPGERGACTWRPACSRTRQPCPLHSPPAPQ
uniref:WAP four-disulfide core domain protein 8 n=1 Tax=Varanus komodoensis TaxID=61221 RepID=A0A8D2KZ50_VARKO